MPPPAVPDEPPVLKVALRAGVFGIGLFATVSLLSVGISLVPRLTGILLGLAFLAWLTWLVWRPGGAQVVGPLFFYDLVRLARRGVWFVRCTYALVLFGALAWVFTRRFPGQDLLTDPFAPGPTLPLGELARFAESFVAAILTVQLAAVLVLTPAYLASAIVEEKEKRTLDLLLTTSLRSREIVAGKLLGRLTHLASVLLAGLPILAVTQWWGGVGVRTLVTAVALTGGTLFVAGGVSILFSSVARTTAGALFMSYGALLMGGFVCCGPLFGMVGVLDEPGGWILYPAIGGFVGVVCTVWAVLNVRPGGPPPAPAFAPDPRVPIYLDSEKPPRILRPYPVSEPPLVWKEAYHGADMAVADGCRDLFHFLISLSLIVIGIFWLSFLVSLPYANARHAAWENLNDLIRSALSPLLRFTLVVMGLIWCVLTGFRTAGSVSKEHERRTLDSLLALPVERGEILQAKWLGGVLRYRMLTYGLAWLGIVGLLSGALHPLAVPLVVVALAGPLAFVASAGLCLSLVCRKTLVANFLMALLLMLLFGGAFLAEGLQAGRYRRVVNPSTFETFWEVGLNPFRGWWNTAFSWSDLPDSWTLTSVLLGALVFGYFAWFLWRVARWRFRCEAKSLFV